MVKAVLVGLALAIGAYLVIPAPFNLAGAGLFVVVAVIATTGSK